MRSPDTHTRPRDSGSAMVEFALVLPVLLLIIMGIVDFGRALNYWIDETHLANEAARFAAVGHNPGDDSGLTLQEWTRAQAVTAELRDDLGMQVCLDFPNGPQVGEPLEVTVTATFAWLPFLTDQAGLTTTELEGSSTMRLEARENLFDSGIVEECAG
jgi:Flp pilus assembly protein TadG